MEEIKLEISCLLREFLTINYYQGLVLARDYRYPLSRCLDMECKVHL